MGWNVSHRSKYSDLLTFTPELSTNEDDCPLRPTERHFDFPPRVPSLTDASSPCSWGLRVRPGSSSLRPNSPSSEHETPTTGGAFGRTYDDDTCATLDLFVVLVTGVSGSRRQGVVFPAYHGDDDRVLGGSFLLGEG